MILLFNLSVIWSAIFNELRYDCLSKSASKNGTFLNDNRLAPYEKTNITIEYIIEDEGSQLTLLKIIEKN